MNRERTLRWIARILGCLLVLILLMPLLARFLVPAEILLSLAFGWWHFLKQNVAQITINWGMIATGLVCSALIVAMANGLLKSLFRYFQRGDADPSAGRWRWRWTICAYCDLWLLFVIAFGANGVLRHATWLFEYPEPWYQSDDAYIQLSMAESSINELLLDNDQDLQTVRKAFSLAKFGMERANHLAETFDAVFYGDKSNKVVAWLLIPRELASRGRGVFSLSVPGTTDRIRPISELPGAIAELDATYPPQVR
jgi:flagellar biosynthesis protein FliQ